MREYAKVSGRFWSGETGKLLRAAGRDAQTIALYLITCPSSNMLGMYYLPLPTLCHEVGISKEGASKALRRVSEASFAFYDASSEYVWVPEMARWQIGTALDPKDKRVTGIKRDLETLRKSPFFNEFLKRYREPFHLQDVISDGSPFEAPSMPHRSQEQEQEQDNKENGAKAPALLPLKTDGDKNGLRKPERKKRQRSSDVEIPAELQPIVDRVTAKMNSYAGTQYQPNSKIILNGLVRRLQDGRSETECNMVVEDRWRAWRDKPDMLQHYNPETLFRESHFEKYLNAARMARNGNNGAGSHTAKPRGTQEIPLP
jgi:uncharacterized phage protein (TIGR02220 family)